MSNDIEQQVIRICERAKHDILALLLSLPATAEPPAPPIQEWMTVKQLAHYWQLLTNDNQPRTAGIMKWANRPADQSPLPHASRSEEHTSELQSRPHLVCRLLLEKKKKKQKK